MKKSFFSIFVSFVVYLLGIEAAVFAQKNGTSNDTSWIPSSTQQNTSPQALDYYYLLFNLSYPAEGKLPIYIIVNPNRKAPSQVSISLYDEFNNIKLLDIADVPLTNYELATPFIVYTWNVISEINSNFNFTTGYFTLVMSYNDSDTTVTKDRRIKLTNVVASPGVILQIVVVSFDFSFNYRYYLPNGSIVERFSIIRFTLAS
ncbi:13946_t:CDS:2 [Dentiscutata erythropus]|uniref:13946_t:CDS:1 n=1 Tax=Dentiscutata erythropus TaxID=1348616 RepID=A0A9N8VD73_9GLOM|nr:13946_t:CDS:2 [Dentiscutata erythropus]